MGELRTNRKKMLARSRPVVQGIFLLFFLFIFFNLSFPLKEAIPNNFFFGLDPLIPLAVALTGSAVLTGLLASVATVIATLLFGRIFCGWVCPMGTIFDLTAHILPKRKKQPSYGKSPFKNIKYYLLAFLLVGSLFGFSAALYFDPLVFLMRVFALNVYPFLTLAGNLGLEVIRPLALKMGMMNLSMFSFGEPVYAFGIVNLAIFLVVLGLIYVERRFWCRNICPLGAFLSILSRFAPWGRKVSDTCISCSKCAKECPMNAIGEDFHTTSARECILCQRCDQVCPTEAVSFAFEKAPEQRFEFNPSRRGLILAAMGGLAAGLSGGTAAARKTTDGFLLRPPGALVEKDFLDICLRCGECMKVCPTNALQPAGLQAGFEGMFTPALTPRIGACEERCNLCGQVCPTGAIRKLPLEEKQYAVIGNAVIERNRCIAWEQLKVCLICDEVCPYDAIEFKMVSDEKGTLQRPFVVEDKCVGCGQCEYGCPVNGPAAIHVMPINEVRKNEGTYITEKVRELRKVNDENVDFYEEYEEGGGTEQQPALQPWEQAPGSDNDLPPGFVE